MLKITNLLRGLIAVAVVLVAVPGWAQRVRFPNAAPSGNAVFQPAPATQPFATPGSAPPLSPVPPAGSTGGGATLGAPSFDPFSTSPGAASAPPSLLGAPRTTPYGAAPPGGFNTASPQPLYGQPAASQPFYGQPAPNPGPYGGSAPAYPGYPQQPPAVFPNGMGSPSNCPPGTWGPNCGWASPQQGPYLRLFSDLRVSYTWLNGNADREVDINDIVGAATMNIPNFFHSGQPLRISPVFGYHLLQGPVTDPTATPPFLADLPSQVYSIYGEVEWDPRLNPQFGAELTASVGLFTDLQTFTTDSMRIQGTGLAVLNLTPTITLKAGATYLDRLQIKMLPAGGILWQPNPQTRYDVYFPKPKLAHYWTTLGNTDVWVYVGGEYGGGSWTVQRSATGASDQVDINDIRAYLGLEWIRFQGMTAFVEGGYVFKREVIYRRAPGDSFDMTDTVMVRGGLSF